MGTVEIDTYVVDTLLPDLVGHDRMPSAFTVYLWLYRMAAANRWTVRASLKELADGTGLSRRAVQDAVSHLHNRHLIGIKRESITAVPEYRVHRPWVGRGG